MGRPRKKWSHSVQQYGSTVRIYEPRLGAPLRWDYRDDDGRHRPGVVPEMVVRHEPDQPTDPQLVAEAIDRCERKAAELRLEPLTPETAPNRITVGEAFHRYHHPHRGGLPDSASAQKHHVAARELWEDTFGRDTLWNDIVPADVDAVAKRLKAEGKVPTADKMVRCLRTVHRWLSGRAKIRGLHDPTEGFDFHKLREGYEPRRPQYTDDELRRIFNVAHLVDRRFRLALALADDSGARGAELFGAMRSGLDKSFDAPIPDGALPYGWLVLPAMKGQRARVVGLTFFQRLEIIRAIWKRWDPEVNAFVPGVLSELEQVYQETGRDYPLIAGGWQRKDEVISATAQAYEGVSDTTRSNWLKKGEKKAGVEHVRRRGWHGIRRTWSDAIHEELGLDVLTAAGGWSNEETPAQIYITRRKIGHIDQAREARDRKRRDDG